MKSRFIAYFTLLTLFISLPLIPVNAAVKAGASCKTLGITSVTSGKTYTCVKTGKKLVWKFQPKGTNPSPRSSTIASTKTRYRSSPSHYELVNVSADLTRVFILSTCLGATFGNNSINTLPSLSSITIAFCGSKPAGRLTGFEIASEVIVKKLMIRIFTIIFAIFFLKFSNFNIFIFLKLIKIPAKFLLLRT